MKMARYLWYEPQALTALIFVTEIAAIVLTVAQQSGVDAQPIRALKNVRTCTAGIVWNKQ